RAELGHVLQRRQLVLETIQVVAAKLPALRQLGLDSFEERRDALEQAEHEAALAQLRLEPLRLEVEVQRERLEPEVIIGAEIEVILHRPEIEAAEQRVAVAIDRNRRLEPELHEVVVEASA